MHPECLTSSQKLPYFGFLPQTAELKYYSVSGFEIPSLPVLGPEDRGSQSSLVEEILYRFQLYLLELHEAGSGRSVALQLTAHPELSHFVAQVRIYVLVRSAKDTAEAAKRDVLKLADQAAQCFPRGGIFNYGQERWLSPEELESALHHQDQVQVCEIVKHEELQTIDNDSLRYVPHRYWADRRRDSWPLLIENLGQSRCQTSVRIELTPTKLDRTIGLESVTEVLQWFSVIDEDMARKASHGENTRADGVTTEDMWRAPVVAWARSRPKYVQRGKQVFEQMVSQSDRLFGIRVLLASRESVSQSVVGATRAALCSPPADESNGWNRPSVLAGTRDSLDSLRWMAQTNLQPTPNLPELYSQLDLRRIVTAEEAVSLFHLPIYDRIGQTSALSTADTPFVIPPETLRRQRHSPKATKIRVGWLYQRERLLTPASHGSDAQSFCVTTSDLMKPSLLVGAPGSGKTNLAVSLLIQLWKERVPFLVLDPSTGQEFRFLLGERSLRKDMVVYTVGDPQGFPLRFNPFSIPPGVTVRNHTNNLMAAFRAAMTMWDPLPAVFEGALELLYTEERFCGVGQAMNMEDQGDFESPAPSLDQFKAALQEQLEQTLAQYKGSEQSIGVIRGGSVVRVEAIIKKLGSILNVPGNGGAFFQRLLRRPAVIELGALGDSSNIALLMAFLLGQVSGHVEYAHRQMAREGKKREHLILIEEAHRLLARGEGAQSKSAEDLNSMLAEVRKFGQGIMTLDQRPSSLVGGVLDNAYVKILTRLSDRVGFERLSEELNMDEAQRRFAHTRLKAGDAILLDREAGMPVLVQSDNVKDALEENKLEGAAFTDQVRANAERWNLVPAEPGEEEEQFAPAVAVTEPLAATPVAVPDRGAKVGVRQKLSQLFLEAVEGLLSEPRPRLTFDVHAALNQEPADLQAARLAVDQAFDGQRQQFMQLAGQLWDKVKWTAVGDVAELYQRKQVVEEITKRMSAVEPESPSLARTRVWFQQKAQQLLDQYLDLERPKVHYAAYQGLAEPKQARRQVAELLQREEPQLTRLVDELRELVSWTLIGEVAELYQNHQAVSQLLQARSECGNV